MPPKIYAIMYAPGEPDGNYVRYATLDKSLAEAWLINQSKDFQEKHFVDELDVLTSETIADY